MLTRFYPFPLNSKAFNARGTGGVKSSESTTEHTTGPSRHFLQPVPAVYPRSQKNHSLTRIPPPKRPVPWKINPRIQIWPTNSVASRTLWRIFVGSFGSSFGWRDCNTKPAEPTISLRPVAKVFHHLNLPWISPMAPIRRLDDEFVDGEPSTWSQIWVAIRGEVLFPLPENFPFL